LSPFSEYALRTIHFPADNPHLSGEFAALIKLTHYPHPVLACFDPESASGLF
jgi:hypothetical protein